jgi:hypothetical protein
MAEDFGSDAQASLMANGLSLFLLLNVSIMVFYIYQVANMCFRPATCKFDAEEHEFVD